MAAQTTALADIVEPKIFADYTVQQSLDKNRFITSGIATSSPELIAAANGGGRSFEMPRWENLPSDDSVPGDSTTDEITPVGFSTDTVIVYKNWRNQAFSYAPVIASEAGSDPAMVVASRISSWDARDDEKILLNQIKGIFDTSAGVLKSTHVNNIALEDGNAATASNLISDDAIQDTRFLLGDAFEDLGMIIMHSTVYKALAIQDLIDFTPVSAQQPTPIPYYHGMRVLIDDNMTVVAGSTSGYKYDTYLFASGSVAFANLALPNSAPSFEVYRDPYKGNGAGQVTLFYRKHRVIQPRGLSFTGSPSADYPTNAEYATTGNWAKKWDTKEIKIVKLVTNG